MNAVQKQAVPGPMCLAVAPTPDPTQQWDMCTIQTKLRADGSMAVCFRCTEEDSRRHMIQWCMKTVVKDDDDRSRLPVTRALL